MAFGPENDNYVGLARSLLEGELLRDPFHPFFYPATTAGVGLVLGDLFLAGKLVSALASGLLVWTVYRLVAAAASPFTGLLAAVAVGAHPYVVGNALVASDAMLSTALCAVVAALLGRAVDHPTRWRVAMAGALFALAYWSRYSTLALLAPAGIALLLPLRLTTRERFARMGVFALSVVACLVPHFLMTYARHGRILYDENWRNLAFAHFGDFDWNFLTDQPFDSWGSVLAHDPGKLAVNSFTRLADYFGRELPGDLIGQGGDPTWIGWLVVALAVCGFVAAVLDKRAGLPLCFGFSVAYLAALVVTFAPWERHVLLALPGLLGAAMLVFHSLVRIVPVRFSGAARAVLVLGVALFFGWRTPDAVRVLIASHPDAERAAVVELAERHGPETVIHCPAIAGFLTFDAEFVPQQLPAPKLPDFDRDAFVRALGEHAAAGSADFWVLGEVVLGGAANFAALAGGAFPPPLVVHERTDDVLVLTVERPRLSVTPSPYTSGPVTVTVTTERPRESVVRLGFVITDPAGETQTVALEPGPDGSARHTIAAPQLVKGTWRLTPQVLTKRTLVSGPAVAWVVR